MRHFQPVSSTLTTFRNVVCILSRDAHLTDVKWLRCVTFFILHAISSQLEDVSSRTLNPYPLSPCRVDALERCEVAVKGEAGGPGESDCAEAGALLLESNGDRERPAGREAARPPGLPLPAAPPLLRQHHTGSSGKQLTSQSDTLCCRCVVSH